MFPTLRDRHYEQAGQPIARITNQLRDLNSISRKELGLGGKNAGRCLVLVRKEKEGELKSLGGVCQIGRFLITLEGVGRGYS